MLGSQAPISASQGQLGSIYITDTAAHTGSFGCVIAVEAAVAALVSGNLPSGSACMSGTLSDVVLPVGVPVFGLFTSITLASGKVIAYNV